jgi:predicted solute-binding protein
MKSSTKTRVWLVSFYASTNRTPIVFHSFENVREYVKDNKKDVAMVHESEWKYMNTKLRKEDPIFSSLGYY